MTNELEYLRPLFNSKNPCQLVTSQTLLSTTQKSSSAEQQQDLSGAHQLFHEGDHDVIIEELLSVLAVDEVGLIRAT